jgi:hypothetical protein
MCLTHLTIPATQKPSESNFLSPSYHLLITSPYHLAAIEDIIPWDTFAKSITEARTLARSEGFDYLHLIGESYSQVRRYTPVFLEVLKLNAAPAAREM